MGETRGHLPASGNAEAAVVSPRIYGRDAELTAILATLNTVAAGHGRVAMIEGPPGSGKTLMLSAAIGLARDLGFTVIACGCLDQRAGTTVLTSGCHPRLLRPGRVVSPNYQLLDIVEQRLPDSPVLVVLDDVHRIDHTELRVISSLTDFFRTKSVMWLLARRDAGRSSAQDHLAPAEASLDLRIPLGSLSADAVAAVVDDMTRASTDPSLRDLVATAEGDPILVIELLEGLCRDGLIGLRDGAVRLIADQLPQCLLEVVDDRIHMLPRQDRYRIQVAAVLGREFLLTSLAAKLEIGPVALLSTLENAVMLNLLRSRDTSVEFTSELLWRAVTELIPNPALAALGMASSVPPESAAPPPAPYKLTSIEMEIIQLVSEGLTNQQIGRRLSRSPHTVNYHIRKLLRKLKVESRAALAARAKSYVSPRSSADSG